MSIRRFYVMPLKANVPPELVTDALSGFTNSDEFINGIVESSAALDTSSSTIIWEMKFISDEYYTGEYLRHPYHAATLDQWLIADSPEAITQDIFTARYRVKPNAPSMQNGVRRLTLLNLSDDADVFRLEEVTKKGEGVTTSILGKDDIEFRYPGKKTEWTHIWEQGFDSVESLKQYLKTIDGVATSSKEGMTRLGINVNAFQSFAYPFSIRSTQPSPATPLYDKPVFYALHARTTLSNAEILVNLLKRYYDKALARAGADLVHRWRTVDQGYLEAEVHSTWQLANIEAVSLLRIATVTDPDMARFVIEGMPLIKTGTRRFYHAI